MAENMEDVDYLYKLLGCDELSSEEQIIREYKIRAKALHPDKNSGDIETTNEFITLTEAKDILCNKDKRKQYDSWRRSGLDISFDVWLKTDQSNHMSMHWAPHPKKKTMIESCEYHIEDSEKSPAENSDKTYGAPKQIVKPRDTCDKAVGWKGKSSWVAVKPSVDHENGAILRVTIQDKR